MFTELFSAIKDNFLEFFILIFSSGISLTGIVEIVRSFISVKKLKKLINSNNDSMKDLILAETTKVFDKVNKVADSLILIIDQIKNIKILSPEQEAYIKTVLSQDKKLLQTYQLKLNEVLSKELNEEKQTVEQPLIVSDDATLEENTIIEQESEKTETIIEETIEYD